MVGDLILGCAIMAALAAGLFLLTFGVTGSLPRRTLNLLGLLVLSCLAWYIVMIWYDVRLAHWLPFSNLIVLGNWLPLFAAVLAGIACRAAAGSRVRQVTFAGALLVTGSYALVYPLLG